MKVKSFHIFYLFQGILKYCPFKLGVYLRRLMYRPFFKYIGKGVVIKDNVEFKFPSEIYLGDYTQIATQCIFVGGKGLYIGKHVLIGAGTKIITSTHNYSNINLTIAEQGLSFKPIRIDDNVWFGFNVVVLGGRNIGTGDILADNCVVVGKVPANTVYGKIKKKKIKER